MIQKLSKLVLVGGMALFFLGTVGVILSGISWGWVNGPVIVGAVGVAVLAVGAFGLIWILGAAEGLLIRFALIFQALRRIRAETEKQEMASDFFTINHPTAGAFAIDRHGRQFLIQPPVGTPQGTPPGTPTSPEPVPEIEEPEPLPPAMDYIGDSQSLILLGPQGTGKTTLMSHLIDARADYGEMIAVVDPHGFDGKYPGVARIIGAGRSYREIDHFFLGMLDEMNRRYQEYNGRNDWTPISIFVDEMTLITQHVESAKQFMESALTEFRKAHMRLVLCLHSRRAKFLGLSGAMDLAEGVDYCNLKKARKERWAELELAGHDEIIYAALPGPYRGGRGGSHGKPGGSSGAGPSRPAWGGPGAGAGFTSGGHGGGTSFHREPEPESEPAISGWIGHVPEPDMTDNRARIWEALYRAAESLTAREIERLTGLSGGYIRKALTRMERAGQIIKERRGRYRLASM